jgi:Protein of unknown function (DUF1761)
MSINWLVLILVVLVQYVIGALWYSVVFQKQWVKINHPDGKPSKEEMARLEKEAMPYYGIQFVVTFLTAFSQWYFISLQQQNWLAVSLILWGGFLIPGVVQTIIWSDPKNKLKLLQFGIMAANLLLLTLIAGWAFYTFK